MKKSLVALAALAAVGVASAQSTTTISGQFRLGVKSDANGTNTLTPDQASGNVMNFDVVEDLGSGLSFVANAQLRFDASNGAFVNQSGAGSNASGFHRLRVGLKSKDLGQILFGRIIFDQLHQYNAFGPTGATLTTVGAVAGATENGQFQYTSPKLYGFNVVLGGSMKGNNTQTTGTPAVFTTSSGGKQFLLNYGNGPFAASYVQEVTRQAAHAKGIGASYDFGVAKVFATKYQDKNSYGQQTVDRWTISAQAPIGPFVARVGYLRDSMSTAERTAAGIANPATRRDKNSLALDYALSKRTTVEAQTYKTKGDKERSLYLGLKHTY